MSFYLDEAGTLKSLPLNNRASSFASLCGYENVKIYGDVYLGRTCMSNEGRGPIRNISFHLFEVDSSADWLKNVRQLNYQHGIKANMVAMETDTADTVNGRETEAVDSSGHQYKWSQTEDTVDINITLPPEIGLKYLI